MSARDGGPAFPRIDGIEPHDYGKTSVVSTDGMTLRDYFAGQALAGLAAQNPGARTTKAAEAWRDGLSTVAYQIADAMLRERGQ